MDELAVPEFDTSVGVRGSAEIVASCVNSTQHGDVVDRCATDVIAAVAAGRTAVSTAVVVAGSTNLDDGESRRAADVTAAVAADRPSVLTAGDRERTISLRQRYDSDFPSLNSSGCVYCCCMCMLACCCFLIFVSCFRLRIFCCVCC